MSTLRCRTYFPQLRSCDRSVGDAGSTNKDRQKTQLPGIQKPDSAAEPTGQTLDYEELTCSPWIGLHYRTVERGRKGM